MKKSFQLVLFLGALGLFLLACDKRKDLKEAKTGEDKVLATVNGEPIYAGEFIERLKRQKKMNPLNFDSLEAKRELLNEMVDFELIFQQAIKEGIHQDMQIKRMMIKSLLKEKSEQIPEPKESDLKEFYNQHLADFEEIRASHILCKSGEKPGKIEADAKKENLADPAYKKCATLEKRLKKGEDFSKLAKEASEDGTKSRGGDLGYFTRKRMVPEFSKAAFALKKNGDLSELVRSKFGYHLIQLTDRRSRTFDEVSKSLKAEWSKEKRKEVIRAFIGEEVKKANIQVFEDKVKLVQ